MSHQLGFSYIYLILIISLISALWTRNKYPFCIHKKVHS